ncbi:MAG: hypothetical protein AMXMBFR58_10950 [Phycisphaerae bacterium]
MHVSFAIPAHNEQGLLPATLDAVHDAARRLKLEYDIVVADDASNDNTAQVARDHGARVVSIQARQIAAARNAAARASTGEVLIFVDADTRVTPSAVEEAIDAMHRGAAGGGAMITFDGPVPWWASVMLAPLVIGFRLFKYTGGCFLFCTRRAFDAAGGWDETLFASEEIEMARRLKKLGRFVIVKSTVITSGRKLRTYTGGEVFRAFLRMGLSPRTAVKSRDKLGLWYDPRREDPLSSDAPGRA